MKTLSVVIWGSLIALCFCPFFLKAQTTSKTTYKTVEEWLTAIRSPDSVVRNNACFSFPKVQMDTKSQQHLFAALRSGNPFAKINIIHAIGKYRLFPDKSVSLLIDLLDDTAETVQEHASFALVRLGEPAIRPLLSYIKYRKKHKSHYLDFAEGTPDYYAQLSLKQLGSPVLRHIKGYKSDKFRTLRTEILNQLSEEELAKYYNVQGAYHRLNKTLFSDDTITMQSKIFEASLQNNFLQQYFFRFINDDLNRERSVAIVCLLLDSASIGSKLILSEKLSRNILREKQVFSRFVNLVPSDTAAIIRNLAFDLRFSSDSIEVDSAGMARLMSLIGDCDENITWDLLKILKCIKPPNSFTSQISNLLPITKLTDCPDASARSDVYEVLIAWDKPELRQLICEGIFDRSADTQTECLEYLHKKFAEDPVFGAALFLFLNSSPVTSSSVVPYAKAIEMSKDLDSSKRALVQNHFDGILNDTTYLNKLHDDELHLMTGIFRNHFTSGKSGLNKVFLYSENVYYKKAIIQAISQSDLRINHGCADLIIKLLRDKDSAVGEHMLTNMPLLTDGPESARITTCLLELFELQSDPHKRIKFLWPTFGHRPNAVVALIVQHIPVSKYPEDLLELVEPIPCKTNVEKQLFDQYLLPEAMYKLKQISFTHLQYCDQHILNNPSLFEAMLEDPKESGLIKEQILWLLGRTKDRRFIPALEKYIYHPTSEAKALAIEQLINICTTNYFRIPGIRDTSGRKDEVTGKISKYDSNVVNCLVNAAKDKNTELCIAAIKGLGLIDTINIIEENLLLSMLHSKVIEISCAAAESILKLGIPRKKTGKYFLYVLNGLYVHKLYVNMSRSDVRDYQSRDLSNSMLSPFDKLKNTLIHVGPVGYMLSGTIKDISPLLPWPLPPATSRDVLPKKIIKNTDIQGQVYTWLVDILHDKGYETKTFTLDSGFAILTNLERIMDNGQPADRERWSTIKLTPLCWSDYFISLLWGTEGRFRAMLFIVTPLSNFKDNGAAWLTVNNVRYLYGNGGSGLSKEQIKRSFAGNHIHVLIYEFYTKYNSEPNLILPGYSSLTVMEQLKATEIIP